MEFTTHFPARQTAQGLHLVDFPFILAQYWSYSFYREAHLRYDHLFALVDNGMHELHNPLGISDLTSVLSHGSQWVGVLPDFLHKPVKSLASLIRSVQLYGLDLSKWAYVIHGSELPLIRFQLDLCHTLGVGVICFPYRSPRWDYLSPTLLHFKQGQRYHLMGLSAHDALERYAELPGKWSLDTGKIIKVELAATSPERWHGHSLEWKTARVDMELVKANLQYLRERTHAGTPRRLS